MKVPYSITPGNISLVVGSKPRLIPRSNANFDALAIELRKPEHDLDVLLELADMRQFLVRASYGQVQIADDEVRYAGRKVHGALADRLLQLLRMKADLEPIALFMDRVMQNPVEAAREELFLWLEAGNAPITPEGRFLAYKRVRDDYMDCHSATVRYQVGDTPTMAREKVDPDRHRTCSHGLHFCQYGYLASFSGARTMMVEIDPADVVAIPSDYSNQKGRAWRLKVLAEIEDLEANDRQFSASPVLGYATPANDETVDETTGETDDTIPETTIDANGFDWENAIGDAFVLMEAHVSLEAGQTARVESVDVESGVIVAELESDHFFGEFWVPVNKLKRLEDFELADWERVSHVAPLDTHDDFEEGEVYRVIEVNFVRDALIRVENEDGDRRRFFPHEVVPMGFKPDATTDTTITTAAPAPSLELDSPPSVLSDPIDVGAALMDQPDMARQITDATAGVGASQASTPTVIDASSPGIIFKTTDGRLFNAEQVQQAINDAGSVRGGGEKLGVARATIQGWVKRLTR